MAKCNTILTIPEPGRFALEERPFPTVKSGYAVIRTEIAPVCLEGSRIWARHEFEELFGGLRYVHQGQKLLDGPAPGETTESWVEPVVGAEYFTEMGGPFWVSIDGDVGGVLFGSEFTWRAGAELGVNVTGPVHLTLAYDYLQTEYGTKESDYRWDEGVSQGWFFGLVIRK